MELTPLTALCQTALSLTDRAGTDAHGAVHTHKGIGGAGSLDGVCGQLCDKEAGIGWHWISSNT